VTPDERIRQDRVVAAMVAAGLADLRWRLDREVWPYLLLWALWVGSVGGPR
jgi:hypothetical protein